MGKLSEKMIRLMQKQAHLQEIRRKLVLMNEHHDAQKTLLLNLQEIYTHTKTDFDGIPGIIAAIDTAKEPLAAEIQKIENKLKIISSRL